MSCDKISYGSKKDANLALRLINSRKTGHKKFNDYKKLKHRRSYKCDRCLYWHLTSQEIRTTNDINKG